MGKPLDYNPIALNYSKTRFAVPWVIEPLVGYTAIMGSGSAILEIGCGTGNYIIELSGRIHHNRYFGFDVSEEMLKVASSRSKEVKFIKGDAEHSFPFSDSGIEMCFAVDVIHHIVNLQNFFNEIFRCLKPDGGFILVTDLEENMKKRSLSKFFPEILQVELNRYPSYEQIIECSKNSGMQIQKIVNAEGYHDINEEFLIRVRSKCSSSMRLIPDDAHKRGIDMLLEAKKRGEKWFSSYTVIIFKKPI